MLLRERQADMQSRGAAAATAVSLKVKLLTAQISIINLRAAIHASVLEVSTNLIISVARHILRPARQLFQFISSSTTKTLLIISVIRIIE